MSSQALVQIFQAVTLVGAALTAVRLFRTSLRKRYPVFFSYFIFWVLNSIWPFFLSGSSHTYYWFWVCTEPIYWTFYVLVVWELCGLVLEKHPGLATLGRWSMFLGLAFSVIVSVASLIPTMRPAGAQWRTTRFLLAVEYGVTLTLVIFLLLMMFLLKGYPVRLSRNVVLHAALFTIFFISNSVGMLFQRLFGTQLYTAVDSVLMAISAICVIVWLIFLNPAGEEVRLDLPHYLPGL